MSDQKPLIMPDTRENKANTRSAIPKALILTARPMFPLVTEMIEKPITDAKTTKAVAVWNGVQPSWAARFWTIVNGSVNVISGWFENSNGTILDERR